MVRIHQSKARHCAIICICCLCCLFFIGCNTTGKKQFDPQTVNFKAEAFPFLADQLYPSLLLAKIQADSTFSVSVTSPANNALLRIVVDSSLFNAFGMEYINAGYRLNYSLSRGIGSLAYSVATLIMGFAISRTSEDIIIPAFMIVQAVVFLALFMIRPAGRNQARTYLYDSGNKKRAGRACSFCI